MSDDKTAFDATFSAAKTEAAPAAPAPTEAPAAPSQPAPDATLAPALAAEPAKHQEAIPLPVFLDMRDKLKAAEKRAADLEAQHQSPIQQIPSVQDEAAFAAYQADQLSRVATSTRFETSETIATEKYGAEPVKAAMDWAMQRCSDNPAFAVEYLRQKHPIDWAIKQQKRHALLDEIGDDVEAYKAKLIAANQPVPGATVAQPSPAAIPQPVAHQPAPSAPRSIASAPTAGSPSSVPQNPGSAFDATFK